MSMYTLLWPSRNVPTAAIVSAAGGMTDALVSIITASLSSVEEAYDKLAAASERQKAILCLGGHGKA